MRERDDRRARVYDQRDQTEHDPRDGLMHDPDLPRGGARELVIDCDESPSMISEVIGTIPLTTTGSTTCATTV